MNDENENEDAEVRIRFIAYGDVDPNDNIDFGVIPDVRVFMIKGGRELADWWDAISDVEMGISSIAPGVQIQLPAKGIESFPVGFVTTRSDGTVETYIEPYNGYTICVISPIINVIAGCNRHERVGKASNYTYYIYFSHGRAYIEKESDGSERYLRSGIVETKFEPGDYLFCDFNEEQVLGCDYEDIAAAQEYIFRVEFGIWPLSNNEGRRFLEEVKNWSVKP